ncbi:MAG: Multidrug efflux pump subunit AcrB [Pseudomonadales bacterium]|nr:Multidrug efflux pump subunit AcrB [Pseudomonadales bacterium]
MARFFIDRPIFAWVIAIIVMLAGVLSIRVLPVMQYPDIAPPVVSVAATYPGASAATLEDTVTQVIEQNMKALDGLLYMSSSSDSYGNASVSITFEPGTDPDIAQVQVQNKLQLALPKLPQEVQQQGLRVGKASSTLLLVTAFYSADGSMSELEVADYMVSNVMDDISRIEGVGDIRLLGGAQAAMRIWLDPTRLHGFALTPADVRAALLAQNAQVSAGQLGGTPAVAGQAIAATINAQSRLQTVEQFEAILLRVNSDGATVRLGDVARIELGSESYAVRSRFNGKPAAGMGLMLQTGANALKTAEAVRARLAELKAFFPPGLRYDIPHDTTPFVQRSIDGVVETLIEAIVLVFLVMLLFLQNLRATLIPTLAVPVVLLGTFAVLAAFGFSINTLTMFAMVLAIGLLVDDAIVVVENVERVMREEGLPPREATRKAMGQISGALVGIALVLSAVFVPMAFFGGSTGLIYRQFSVTIVSAMVLSVLVAMILTPALCATLLHPHDTTGRAGRVFGAFNRALAAGTARYEAVVGGLLRRSLRYLVIYAVLLVVLGLLFVRLPTSFLPEEDGGFIFNIVQLPAGASQERTLQTMAEITRYYLEEEKGLVTKIFTAAGFSFAGAGQNAGQAFVEMRPWEEREEPGQSVRALADRARAALQKLPDAVVFPVVPPPVRELGDASGFTLFLQDRGGLGHAALIEARNRLLGAAAQHPRLRAVRPNGLEDTPQLELGIDHQKASALGLSIAEINDVLATAWGGRYVNDFIDRGRVKKVYLQGEAGARMQPGDLGKWYARNARGQMVPFNAFASARWTRGSPQLTRFNGLPAIEIQGQAAPGVSTGEAMHAIAGLIGTLPAGIGFEWSGVSLQEQQSGAQAPLLYALSLLVVFLCLAALYESWSVPFAVMLVVPLGVIGALLAATLAGQSNDVYFQVGLLTTIGLSARNAILIVEFAKARQEAGATLLAATLDACRIRLRPILMTSLAFVFGVLPLALADGAGSGAQNAIGTGVVGGMLSATVLAIFYVPLFYTIVRGRSLRPRVASA